MAHPTRPPQVLRLYITAASPKSARAIVNLRRILEESLPGGYDLEVLDISEHVERARADQILVAPTLLRVSPEPLRRIIGDMSDTAKVRAGLDLPARDSL